MDSRIRRAQLLLLMTTVIPLLTTVTNVYASDEFTEDDGFITCPDGKTLVFDLSVCNDGSPVFILDEHGNIIGEAGVSNYVGNNNDDNNNDDDDDDECENPPTAASCNNVEDDNDNCEFGPGNCGSGSCYSVGVEQGKNGDYNDGSRAVRECIGEFRDRYYQGFIDGCISADNTRNVCESATDA